MRSGQLIANRYRLVELVGSGGSGLVWLADDEVEHRQVALKRPHSAEGPAARTELEREARVAARVDHPNAIRVHEVVGDGPDSWLVMEYFPARDLGAVMRERGPLDPAEVARIGAQVAAALAAIHEADVVHRDVTPNNILVADSGVFSGTAKVTDYGISAHRAQTVTSSGKISGTAVYVSPEVADGSVARAPSDVFSLGASLFAAVEGAPPFGFGDPDLILARIRAGRREPAHRAGPLAPVLEALLHSERDARPTAARARDMLAQVVDGQPVEAWQPPVPRRRRDRRVLAAGLVAVLLAGGVVVWSPWQTSAGDPAEPAGPKRTVVGDPRTADPCALLEPETFERFGPAVEDPAYGNFNRCDVLIELGEDTEVDIDLELLAPTDPGVRPPPDAKVEVEAAEVDDEGGCDVSITLADLYRIDVNARPDGDVTLDVCELAQVAGDRAVELLPHGQLTRRPEPFDVDSLARVDACRLLDRAALRAIPGLDPEPEVAFGRWVCEWSGRAATMGAELFFNQNTTLTAEDGQLVRLAGHDVFLQPDEDGEQECRAHVVHRAVHLDNGEDIDEIASLSITGDAPVSRLCTVGRTMARSVAAKLPPVS